VAAVVLVRRESGCTPAALTRNVTLQVKAIRLTDPATDTRKAVRAPAHA